MLVRFRVACRGRVEIHELQVSDEGPDILIGRGESVALRLFDKSIAPEHAQLSVRRGRFLLSAVGSRHRTSRGGERVLAPVVISEGERFDLGDVCISAEIPTSGVRSLVGRDLSRWGLVPPLVEIDSPDPGLRRYEARSRSQRRVEIAHLTSEVAADDAERWIRTRRLDGTSLLVEIDRQMALIEDVIEGVRLAHLLDAVERSAVVLPLEAATSIFALIAEALAKETASDRAHGGIDPRRIQLGTNGSIKLLSRGPGTRGAIEDQHLAPERRMIAGSSTAGDAFALGVIGKRLMARQLDCPPRLRAVAAWLAHVEPERRPKDLTLAADAIRHATHDVGVDATYGHVARIARMLAADLSKPLAEVVQLGSRAG